MSKIHGLSDLTAHLHDLNDPALATPFDYQTPSDYQLGSALVASGVAVSASAVSNQVLYLTEPGDPGAISLNDIHQGHLGDCFLLSSIGEIAMLQPSFISNMIHANSSGTQTVALYEASNGRLPGWNTTAFKAVNETVTDVFSNAAVNNGASQDVVGNQKEIWPQVVEKAVAALAGGYSSITNGGSPVLAMEELTGHAATSMAPATLTLAALQTFIKAGDLIVMDTLPSGGLPNNLVSGHAYMFESVTGSGASASVHLGNPWGFDQPTSMLLSQLSRGIAEVDIGRLA